MKRLLSSGVVIAILLMTSLTRAEQPVKIGFLYALAGKNATLGAVARQGVEMVLDEINTSTSRILGREVIGIFETTGAGPAAAVEKLKKLVTENRVNVVIAAMSEDTAVHVVEAIKRLKVPLILTAAANPDLTGKKCNRYTFRITWTAQQRAKAAAIIGAKTKATTWTTLSPDKGCGLKCWELFKGYLAETNPEALVAAQSVQAFAPSGTSDWSPYIATVVASKAAGVLVTLERADLITFLRQAKDEGLFDAGRQVLIACPAAIDVFLALRSRMPVGIWVGAPYWHGAKLTSENFRFVQSYMQRFGYPASYAAEKNYSAVKVYVKAVEKAGSLDGKAVVKALAGLSLRSDMLPVGKLTIRAEDHQALFDIVWGRTSSNMAVTSSGRRYRMLDAMTFVTPEQLAIPAKECNLR